MYVKPGDFGNLPARETCTAPIEGSTEGVVIVEGSMAPLGLLNNPIKLSIKSGRIAKIEGGDEAARLKMFLESLTDPYAHCVAEFTGTVHLRFSTNVSMGGTIKSKTHIHDYVETQ